MYETFGAANPSQTIPHLWNDLKPLGTLYTNFRIAHEGETVTNPGHSTIATGTWQHISNSGGEYPHMPTLFEYFRKELGASETDNLMIGGKSKLEWIKRSDHPEYGETYQANWSGNNERSDLSVYSLLDSVMNADHPRLIIVNFPETDTKGHSGNWPNYLDALAKADGLINELWLKIQSDNFYMGNTTLFITNDHGRHDDDHGGFQNHGDDCDGCEHIMCLALGRHVLPNQVIDLPTFQTDIAPTVGVLLGFATPYSIGQHLYGINPPLPVVLLSFSVSKSGTLIELKWKTETELNNYGFDIERATVNSSEGGKAGRDWVKIGFVEGAGNSNSVKEYSFVDDFIFPGSYLYRLKQVNYDGTFQYSRVIEVNAGEIPAAFALEQNYPNPFNPSTTINYNVPVKSEIRLVIYNVLGEKINYLVNGLREAGNYSVEFNAAGLPTGIYFYVLRTDSYVQTRKMMLIR
jgi:hypothetical protein